MRTERRDPDGDLLSIEVEPTTDADRAEADAGGLVLVREVVQMRIALPLTADAPPFTTRPFEPGVDDDAFLRCNNRAFEWHPDQSDWTIDHLRARCAEPWFDPDGFLLHEVEGRLCGFCWTKVHPATDHDPALGEIYVIGVDPDLHGRGLGRSLVIAGLRHLTSVGLRVGMLHVERDNVTAASLYRALGFTEHSSHSWFASPDAIAPR